MADIDVLLRQVSAKAAETSDEDELPPAATAEQIESAEQVLGFRLPPLLTRLYREVANGGFGPAYRLLPLTGEGRTAVGEYREVRATRKPGETSWPAAVLPILDWGCGMYAAVDCRDPGGAVLLFEPNGVGADWHDAWYVDAESLVAWLEIWLSETGWYEGDVAEGYEEAREPQPWEAARARLSEPD
ncbi:SMI1/KNR4 family protein [Spongiactinospora sp. TRM90649]|uniref:SMI1/KNR4 family protein n=1 Tax=Spongiactinospora sp. TRM90649 TaxID=3031114 RepID=UPI0023F8171C|nr:SMI1/KNR4 family protein [Spongiactinospora sp. TRM90649]MDF5752946.1 SMI1/KNR4 family protein [Spongiactinospora sp. TRM90649]